MQKEARPASAATALCKFHRLNLAEKSRGEEVHPQKDATAAEQDEWQVRPAGLQLLLCTQSLVWYIRHLVWCWQQKVEGGNSNSYPGWSFTASAITSQPSTPISPCTLRWNDSVGGLTCIRVRKASALISFSMRMLIILLWGHCIGRLTKHPWGGWGRAKCKGTYNFLENKETWSWAPTPVRYCPTFRFPICPKKVYYNLCRLCRYFQKIKMVVRHVVLEISHHDFDNHFFYII